MRRIELCIGTYANQMTNDLKQLGSKFHDNGKIDEGFAHRKGKMIKVECIGSSL